MTDPSLPRDPGPEFAPDDSSAYVRAVEEAQATTAVGGGVGLTPSGSTHGPSAVSRFISHPWFAAGLILVAVALPFINSSLYLIRISTFALIFIMLAVGLNIVVGYCGLLDLGYAAFWAIGAYTAGLLTTKLGWPVVATLPFVIVAACIGGIVIGAPTLRLRSDYLAIVTLGFGEIIRITATNLDFTGRATGMHGIPSFGSFGFRRDIEIYWITAVVVGLAVIASSRLGRGRLGRAWRFVREDEDAAEAMGIHTYRIKFAAYVTGAIFGGLAGVLFAVFQTAVAPQSFTFLWSALILMAVVLGGMGSTPGVVVGALVIALLPEFLRGAENWRYFIFGLMLIVVMIFRPQGIWPQTLYEQVPRRLRRRRKESGATS